MFREIKNLYLHNELIEHRRVQPLMQALVESITVDILQDIHQVGGAGAAGLGALRHSVMRLGDEEEGGAGVRS